MKLLIITVVGLFALGGSSFAQEQRILVDGVAGIVGDNVILHSDVELQYQQALLERAELPEEFKCALFDQMLSQKLLIVQAAIDSIVVSEEEIEDELNKRVRYFVSMIGSEERLEDYYGKSIIQIKDEFKRDIEEQLLANRMRQEVLSNVKVTPSEVREFFNSIPEDSLPYFNAEVEVGQIVINPSVSPELKEYARQTLEGIRKRVEDGEDFCLMVQLYSEDPGSANDCGNLGFIRRGEMVPEFEGAAFRLEVNEVSDIVETQFGFHIIQCLEKKGDRVKARHILVRPKTTSADLANAKTRLDSIRALIITGQMTFGEAAGKFSEDEGSKNQGGMLVNPATGNTYFEIDQLEKEDYFAIEKLSPGEVSEPQLFQTPQGLQSYRIMFLKSETAAHKASLKEDYSRIKAAATQQKEEEMLNKWMEDKAGEAYVFISDDYNGCSLIKKWTGKDDVIEKTYH